VTIGTVPGLSFPLRSLVLLLFLGAAVWGKESSVLCLAGLACLLYRYVCCHSLLGTARDVRGTLMFTLLVMVLGAPSRFDTLGELGWQTFWRFFLFVSPSMTFSACLYPREGAYYLQRFFPRFALLGLEIALRGVPLLIHEAGEVRVIQQQRGAFAQGPLRLRLKAFLLPFFLRLFRMADRVAFSLRSRGISPDAPRLVVSPQAVRGAIQMMKGEKPCSK
jgi:energy-coupling factor transporter transmembrane protein EcfT